MLAAHRLEGRITLRTVDHHVHRCSRTLIHKTDLLVTSSAVFCFFAKAHRSYRSKSRCATDLDACARITVGGDAVAMRRVP
jgi:hypothetical protein